MLKADVPKIALRQFNGSPDQAPGNRPRSGYNIFRTEQYRRRSNRESRCRQPLDLRVPISFLVLRPLGRAGQILPQCRIPFAGQPRQKIVADPVAREIMAGISRILAPCDSRFAEIAFNIRAVRLDQGAHDAVRRRRPHARKPSRARTAQKPEQHRLSLIGARMARGDAVEQPAT